MDFTTPLNYRTGYIDFPFLGITYFLASKSSLIYCTCMTCSTSAGTCVGRHACLSLSAKILNSAENSMMLKG
jgi:hypothetical protein